MTVLGLPGILLMAGQSGPPLPTVSARLTGDLKSRHRAWTEFRGATLSRESEGDYTVTPYESESRLQSLAEATGLVCIPEGVACRHRGETVTVQLLAPACGDLNRSVGSNE